MSVKHSLITIKRGFDRALSEQLSGSFVLTDDNVHGLYGTLLKKAAYVCVVKSGEDSKTLLEAENVLRQMAQARLDRKSRLVALGGGVVGDLGGFCAAVYMRGIEWVNIPTTLLAQLDSSIGGKTGVDLTGYKNMVGAFHLPEKIMIYTDFLDTLPQREIKCGLGEAVKCALLDEKCMSVWRHYRTKCDSRDFFALVEGCARFKESVVKDDFKESGKRKILNLGHTIGHALEYLDCHRKSHGEYVALGLAAEAGVALKCGLIAEESYKTILGEVSGVTDGEVGELIGSFSGESIAAAAMADKKNRGGKISVVISENFRRTEYFLDEAELAKRIEEWKSDL